MSPFAVHNTYQYSGTAGKIARFRENGLWAVDDAAYFGVTSEDERFDSHDDEQFGDAKRRFLLLTYDVPGALADPAPSVSTPKGGTPVTHVDLIRYQVNRVRDGLALASVFEPDAHTAAAAEHVRPVVQPPAQLHAGRRAFPDGGRPWTMCFSSSP